VKRQPNRQPVRFAGEGSSSRRRGWFVGLLLVAATFLVYLPVWQAGFIWDDDTFLVANPLIKQAGGLYRFWCTTAAADYFPATSTNLWLEWRLWGNNPLGYHLTNVLLHALSAVVLWRVLVRLKIAGAMLAAALFALHPVNVESVAWITERKNTLAMFFFALTLLWYLRFEDTGRRRWYWLGVGAFVMALLSKTAVVMLPIVLLGIAWWRRGRVGRPDVWRSVPFFAASVLLGLVTVWFQYHQAIGSDVVREDSFWSRLAGAGWAVWFYLYKAVLPLNLTFVYPRWPIEATNVLSYAPGLLVVAGFVVCWRYRNRWGKGLLFGLGYFLVMLLPVLGFLNIYFMRFSLVADHWQYFSILGPLALAAAGITLALNGIARGNLFVKPTVVVTLLLVLGVLTWRQVGMYADSETLWRTTIARNPKCHIAHVSLGNVLYKKGQLDDAIRHYQMALAISPDFSAHMGLGCALLYKGQLDEAIHHCQEALAIFPDKAEAHYNLANALLYKGQLDEAISHFQKALDLRPDHANACNNLGYALLRKGQVREAVAHYQMALQIQPDSAGPYNNLAWVLATCPEASVRNGGQAITLAQQANQLSGGQNPVMLKTLAAAYAEAGRFPEAIAAAQRALDLAAAQSNTSLAKDLRAQIELYRTGSPFRDTHQTDVSAHPSQR